MQALYSSAEKALARLVNAGQASLLKGGSTGLEKECLRVAQSGGIARTPHPRTLGSALTNPYITTDYSEAQLELITPPFVDMRESLQFLRDTQQFVYSRLDDELLWATSMPCILAGEDNIPIAQYGSSNAGLMKTVYRRGLGHRYGRVMQVISGVHFNYSFPGALWPVYRELCADERPLQEFITDSYFSMIRNLLRFGWLVPYLFGASPAVCKSFMYGKPVAMQEFDESTYFEPYATSLRMGDIGYQNRREAETGVRVGYNSIDDYIASLRAAIETPCPAYEKIGVIVDGEYQQLNTHILQIENEYYSSVRPKQVPGFLEKPIRALRRHGVRYVELRSLDVNAYDPLGINEEQCRFLEAMMIFCLLLESPPFSGQERDEIDTNLHAVAHKGREPALVLPHRGASVPLREWALALCRAIGDVGEVLDAGSADGPYRRAVHKQIEAVREPDRTPSARMLAEMRDTHEGFYDFARRMSQRHHNYFLGLPADGERFRVLEESVRRSLDEQRRLEESDDIPFNEFLRRYFAQTL
jgi:glutamate--cysteine ligase